MAGTVAAMRARPKASVALAVFLIVAGLTLGLAREAIAYTFDTGYDRGAYNFPRDSNGLVPESEGRLNGDGPPSTRTSHKYGQANVYFYTGPGPENGDTFIELVYDWRETDYCNIPRDELRLHERAHSRGWAHNKENYRVNKAYYGTRTCFPSGTGGN